ncbi:MAG: hypothetical protein ACLQU2_32400 [Candidatus Binataceae bacterium]
MAAFALGAVTPAHRRYLLVDNGVGPLITNLVINGMIAWLIYRNATHVPLWGQSSIAGDTIATSFLLPLITCLIVTPMARGKVRAGHVPQLVRKVSWNWLPHNAALRGVVIGIACLLVLTPLTLLGFRLLGIYALKPWHFVYFKSTFAAFEGLLVTPLLALWAISDISRAPGTSVSPIEKLAGVS